MTFLTLPQAPVVAGEAGHLNDHDLIQAGLQSLWQATMQSFVNVCAPPYSADPTGVADSTVAIQNAINAADAANGVVCIPAGTYRVTPASTTVAGLILNNGSTGCQNMRIVGAGQGTVLLKTAAGPLIDMSGPATDTTGATHCRWCSLESLQLNGNGFAGTLVRTYYADDLYFRDVQYLNNADVAHDTAEFWDSRFYNCVWQSCGSTTANASTPNVLLRNSAAASGYGASTDNVNNIHFTSCRFEGAKTGSIWVQQGVSNSNNENAIRITDCKMETSAINGGPHLLVDANAKDVQVKGLYCYSGGFTVGYSTAQDVITWSPQDGVLQGVFIANKTGISTVANGVTVNATVAGQNSIVRDVTGIYPQAPTGQHVAVGTATGSIELSNCLSNIAAPTTLNAAYTFVRAATSDSIIGSIIGGDTAKRLQVNANGTTFLGPGTGAADVEHGRTATGVWSLILGIFDAQHGTKTSVGATAITPTLASGTAAQLSDTTKDYQVYFTITTAGTAFSVAIGPTSTPANTIVTSNTPNVGESVSFRLPAGWFVKWAGTGTALNQIAVSC